jgi:hypothetical protein
VDSELPKADIERLAEHHVMANNPDEPYQGVAALFNGDLHMVEPDWAPRNHWHVLSPYVIKHLTVEEIKADG